MPDNAHVGSLGGLSKVEVAGGIRLDKAPKIALGDTKIGEAFDFVGHLDSMSAQARTRQADHSDLAVTVLDLGVGLVDLNRAAVSESERLLQQARDLIAEKKYEDALDPLQRLLAESEAHHEARFLTAFCHVSLQRHQSALETLLPFRGIRVGNALATRIEVLRQRIRSAMFLPVTIENILLVRTQQIETAIGRLRTIVPLDPEVPHYHFLLAGTLMLADRFDEALRALDEGVASCPGADQSQMETLRREIERRHLVVAMAPARDLYRAGRFADALKSLRRINTAYHQAPLFRTFHAYLTALSAGGLLGRFARPKTVANVTPPGTFKHVDALHFFLVADEIQRARVHIEKEEFTEAENAARVALRHAPHFPFAHFLCGHSMYRRMGKLFEAGTAPDLDVAIRDMEQARAHARLAAKDDEIRAAPSLVKVAEEALEVFRKAVDERNAIAKEAKPINEAIAEFNSVLESAKGGIGSAAQLRQIHGRMGALRKRTADLKLATRSAPAKQALAKLADQVQSHFRQLEKLKRAAEELETVNRLGERFRSLMDDRNRKGPFRTRQELNTFTVAVVTLKQEAANLQRKVESQEAKNSLEQLAGSLQGILAQLHV